MLDFNKGCLNRRHVSKQLHLPGYVREGKGGG